MNKVKNPDSKISETYIVKICTLKKQLILSPCNDNLGQNTKYVLALEEKNIDLQTTNIQAITIGMKFKFILSKLKIGRDELYKKI